MIRLNQPLFFSEIGLKDNQEDFTYPAAPDENSRVFILCDGMGGHERGEVASSIVATTIGSILDETADNHQDITPERFDKALTAAYDALETIDGAESDRKPGTTLASVCFNKSTVLAAHIGDSRIYQLRPDLFNTSTPEDAIIYRSEDHSLVNDLVKAGQIRAEEARNHPRRNVITRALQPRLSRRFKATVYETNDVLPGDYFFLCSDGILERISDRLLCEILSAPLSDNEKLDAIKAECMKGTRDNFSCYLIPVRESSADKPANYKVPLIILCAVIAIAAAGIVSYYAGWFHSEPLVQTNDTIVAVEDSTVVDTLLLATPLPDSVAQPDTIPPVHDPVLTTEPDRDTLTTTTKAADVRHDSIVAPAPSQAAATQQESPKAVSAPEDTKPSTGGIPPRPKKDNSGAVPPPVRKKDSTPKPLA